MLISGLAMLIKLYSKVSRRVNGISKIVKSILQLQAGQELPPPSFLKRKIIIKNKKKQHHHKKHHKKHQGTAPEGGETLQEIDEEGAAVSTADGENSLPPDVIPQSDVTDEVATAASTEQQIGNGEVAHAPMLQQRQGSKDSTQDDDGS